MDFAAMMHLEPHGADVFVAVGPRYPWGGLFGGQIVAQALRAGSATVDGQLRVHSLHAYFIRRGNHGEPIRFEVDRTRNGRSFATRQVTARQSVGVILSMSISFQMPEEGHDVQIAELPDVERFDALPNTAWTPMFERRPCLAVGSVEGRGASWLRVVDEVGDDPVLQACALAYLSDDVPTDAVISLHPERPRGQGENPYEGGFMSASLDHAIWFHRPQQPGEWHLHDFASHGYLSSRGLAIGHVLTAEGVHVATIAQEVLLRKTSLPSG